MNLESLRTYLGMGREKSLSYKRALLKFSVFHSILQVLLLLVVNFLYAEKITVLTYPVGRHSPDSWCHPAVTQSLLRGFGALQVDYNYNPSQEHEVGSTVVVLTNMDALKQAIRWKRAGRIKKLLAGPNLVISPKDHSGIILAPEIDKYMVNSEWTKTAYIEDAPELIRSIAIWPAGVDIGYWNPSQLLSIKKTNNVLVYWKTESIKFCQAIEEVLRKNYWNPVRIQYGHYTHEAFKQALNSSSFAVFISRSESQGLALAEAWAMDVPTIVWNPRELVTNGRTYTDSSACPYLTPQTGADWKHIQEFEYLLSQMPTLLASFSPRAWTLQNMSDTASASTLLSLINSIQNHE